MSLPKNVTIILVFVPLENLLSNVEALIKTLASKEDYAVIGWCREKYFWTRLENEITKSQRKPLFVLKQAENVGKAQLINLAMSKVESLITPPHPTYVTFCDCDLKLEVDTVQKLLACADQVPNLGLISSNQSQNNCRHSLMDEDPVVILPNGQQRVVIPQLVTAVSGGLFTIPLEVWFQVGPLPTLALYYNEEVILNLRLSLIDKVVCVASYVVAEHPTSKDQEYDAWKLKQLLEEHYILGPYDLHSSDQPYLLVGPDRCKVHLKFPSADDSSSKYKNRAIANCVEHYRERYQKSFEAGKIFWKNK